MSDREAAQTSDTDDSTRGCLRVTIWSAVTAPIFVLAAISQYSKHRIGPIVLVVSLWVVVALLSAISARQIFKLENIVVPRKQAISFTLIGAGIPLVLTLLGYFDVIPVLDFHVYATTALWMSTLFVSAYVTERRRNVKLYYALEGLVVKKAAT